jgi:hypothetical protein
MFEVSETATIRRLPRGAAQPARIEKRASDRLGVWVPAGGSEAFEAGALVEIDGEQAVYLGEVVDRHPDSSVTITVQHLIDRVTLAEIEKGWKTGGA